MSSPQSRTRSRGAGGGGGGGGGTPIVPVHPNDPLIETISEDFPAFTATPSLTENVDLELTQFDALGIPLTENVDGEFTRMDSALPTLTENVDPEFIRLDGTAIPLTENAANNTYSLTASGFTPVADADYQDLAVCTDSTNVGTATTLHIVGVIATKRDAIIAFDMSRFVTSGSSVTVSSATLHLTTATAVGVASGGTATISVLSNLANENIPTGGSAWTETGIICANKPAIGGSAGTTAVANSEAANTHHNIALTGASLALLGSQIGRGSVSFIVNDPTGATSLLDWTIASRENATTANRPTLDLTFQVVM